MAIRKRTVFYIVIGLFILLAMVFIYWNQGKLARVFSPFFIALIIAYLINPLVTWLEKKRVRRNLAIMLVYLLFIAVLAVVFIFILPELTNNVRELSESLPGIITGGQGVVQGLLDSIQSSNWPADIKDAILNELNAGTVFLQDYVADILKKSLFTILGIMTSLVDLLLALIIAYYIITDKEMFVRGLESLAPKRWRSEILAAGKDINQLMSNFLQGQLTVALIIGLLESIGLWIVQVRYPIVLGVIGGLFNVIPYFGPLLGAVPAVALALIQSPVKALWAAAVFVTVQQLDNIYISTTVIEKKMGLHPVTTILAVLIGGEFFGIFGMFISIPVTAILKVIAKRIIEAVV